MYKNILIVLLASLLLQGCAAVAVGGAGAAGYYVGKDKRDFNTIMEDAGITAAINSDLLAAKGVKTFDINVDTYNGVVYLTGHVPSGKIKHKVIKICKKTKGVKKVVSKLKIKK